MGPQPQAWSSGNRGSLSEWPTKPPRAGRQAGQSGLRVHPLRILHPPQRCSRLYLPRPARPWAAHHGAPASHGLLPNPNPRVGRGRNAPSPALVLSLVECSERQGKIKWKFVRLGAPGAGTSETGGEG